MASNSYTKFSYGKPYMPPAGVIDPKAPSPKEKVRDIIGAMDTQSCCSAMAASMAINPPAPEVVPWPPAPASLPGAPAATSNVVPKIVMN